jgi:hypothetical protein
MENDVHINWQDLPIPSINIILLYLDIRNANGRRRCLWIYGEYRGKALRQVDLARISLPLFQES